MTWKKISIDRADEIAMNMKKRKEQEEREVFGEEVCDCNDGWTRCPGGANCDFPNPEQDPNHRHLCEKCNGTTIIGRPAPAI